jgi:hypothetical protein
MLSEESALESPFGFRLCANDLRRKPMIEILYLRFSGQMTPNEIIAKVNQLNAKTVLRIRKEHVIMGMPKPVVVGRNPRMLYSQHAVSFSELVFKLFVSAIIHPDIAMYLSN